MATHFSLTTDYNDTHRALQKFMRKFADEVVIPEAQAHEKSGKRPSTELIKKMGDLHINAMVRITFLQTLCDDPDVLTSSRSEWDPESTFTD